MTEQQLADLHVDFREWSGGWPPDSIDQIDAYIAYAAILPCDEAELRRALIAWLGAES